MGGAVGLRHRQVLVQFIGHRPGRHRVSLVAAHQLKLRLAEGGGHIGPHRRLQELEPGLHPIEAQGANLPEHLRQEFGKALPPYLLHERKCLCAILYHTRHPLARQPVHPQFVRAVGPDILVVDAGLLLQR